MPSIPSLTEIIRPYITAAVTGLEGRWVQENSTLRVTAPFLGSRVIAVITMATAGMATGALTSTASPVLFLVAFTATVYAAIDLGYISKISWECSKVGNVAFFARYMDNSQPEHLLLKILVPACNPIWRRIFG